LSELEEHERWSPEKLAKYQEEKLRDLLCDCADNVPYYVDLFGKLRLDPRRVAPLECLKSIPPLEKSIVRKNPEQF